jgi:predicted ATPase
MFQRVLNWRQDDTPQAKLDKLEQTLRAYRLELDEAMPLFANLLSLTIPEGHYPSLNISPQQQRQRTLGTILTMLLQQAEEQPVLFILEDLHWTDPSTLEVLDMLLEQTPTATICVLLTCRPEFEPSWGNRSYLNTIALNRLSHSQIENMAERVAGGKRLPAEVLQQLVEKTDGVPLFVEEMTKAVLESGTLKEVNGQYEPIGSLHSLAIPATLQDSLMARLDRLMTAKVIAQLGATIGRQFRYELLQAVAQLDEPTLQRELGRLVEAELLYQRGLPPHATYTFKHALIQDTARESLLRSTRQGYHRCIAEVLAERFPETLKTQPELLAHHYTEAGLCDQAIPYWQQAGQQALQRSAYQEAIGQVTKGLELIQMLSRTPGHLEQELTLQTVFSSAVVAMQGQGSHEAFVALDRARELCHEVDDPQRLFPVLRGLWMYSLQQKDSQKTSELAEQLLALAERQQDTVLCIVAHQVMGATLVLLGAFAAGRDHCEQGIALYDRQQHQRLGPLYGQDPGVSCLVYGAWSLWHLGYPDQALNWSQEAIDLAQDVSHPVSLSWALSAASWTHTYRREGRAAYELAEAAIDVATTHDFPHWIAMGKLMRGQALAELGHWDSAVAQIREGTESYHATGARTNSALVPLAKVYGQSGRFEEGLHVLTELLVEADRIGTRQLKAEGYRLKGELLLQQAVPDAAQAESCFHQAISIAQSQQAKSWELRAATSLARLWQSQGKRQEAYDLIAPVYAWFTEGFDTADLREAKALLDELGE